MKYCKKCVYPFVGVNLHISDDGICSSCKTFEKLEKISDQLWEIKRKKFEQILNESGKNNKSNYDCLIPVSGGKDSYYQTHVVAKKYVPIVNFMATLGIIGRGLALPPGAPKKLVGPLRKAFANMVKDPAYVADTKKARLRVMYTSGEDIQKFVNDAISTANPTVVGQARKLIFGK